MIRILPEGKKDRKKREFFSQNIIKRSEKRFAFGRELEYKCVERRKIE